MSQNPYDALRRLRDRMQQLAEAIDLDVINVMFHPDEDGVDRVSVLFEITPEAVKSSAEIEQEAFDEAFEDLAVAFEGPDSEAIDAERQEEERLKAQTKAKEEEAKAKMREWIKGQDE